MARQAGAVQLQPMTLVALTEQIQAAVEPQGWTAWVVREGDCLVVDLMAPLCPDPLLAMMAVEAELGRFDTAGLEAVKLYGHCSVTPQASRDPGTAQPESPGWMSVIDLGYYFSRRAALSPEAFGLAGAEASRMACEAERDRHASAFAATSTAAAIALETEPVDPIVKTELQAAAQAPNLAGNGNDSFALEDAWEGEPPAGKEALETAGAPAKAKGATQALASLTGYDLYRAFIAEQSSWFAQTVKANPRLHALAKQRQHYTIGTLSHYLVDTLTENERLMDLVPVRKRDRGCGLIFTDQRVIALSQTGRRDCDASFRRNRQGLQVWMVPWSWVHKVEICHDALRFYYGRAKECFRVDLEAPYHLRNAIPCDIPVRMIREMGSSKKRVLDTKVGLAMVAGVMFALGSGFSLLNHAMNLQAIEVRSNPLATSRSSIQADLPGDELGDGQNPSADAAAAPLVMTTNHEQCVDSFNNASQPHAYATLNQVTQTLQVNLQNPVLLQMSPQQFNRTAAAVAQEILSSCQAKAISQVVVTNGAMRYQQRR